LWEDAQIYRAFRFGDLMDLVMLVTRPRRPGTELRDYAALILLEYRTTQSAFPDRATFQPFFRRDLLRTRTYFGKTYEGSSGPTGGADN